MGRNWVLPAGRSVKKKRALILADENSSGQSQRQLPCELSITTDIITRQLPNSTTFFTQTCMDIAKCGGGSVVRATTPPLRIPRPHGKIREVFHGQAGRISRTSPCQRAENHEHFCATNDSLTVPEIMVCCHNTSHNFRSRLPQKPHSPFPLGEPTVLCSQNG